MATSAPAAPAVRSIRRIQSPTVGRTHQNGPEAGTPLPVFEGSFLGQRFIQGVAEVDEDATWPCVNPDTLQPKQDRVWHLLLQDWGMLDITPADQPPRYPLPGAAPVEDEAELERLTAPSL